MKSSFHHHACPRLPRYVFQGGEEEEEAKNFNMALGKIRTAHTNVQKLIAKVTELAQTRTVSSAHGEIKAKLMSQKDELDKKSVNYLQILQNKVVPGNNGPTNSDTLKKILTEDPIVINTFVNT